MVVGGMWVPGGGAAVPSGGRPPRRGAGCWQGGAEGEGPLCRLSSGGDPWPGLGVHTAWGRPLPTSPMPRSLHGPDALLSALQTRRRMAFADQQGEKPKSFQDVQVGGVGARGQEKDSFQRAFLFTCIA